MKPDFNNRPGTRHSGYALILMVLALMGIGGVVLAGFTQDAKVKSERERYLHNERVLLEAKQALLQYAYNYPQLGPDRNDGPGRLLCPDTLNDGLETYVPGCGGNMIGRFPWKEAGLDFYDARDASGETLWYAVSRNFGRGPGSKINYDSHGSITIEDRSGAVLYDGSDTTAGSGIAAVIFAPGAPLQRGATMQVRGTADEKKEVTNYLDLFGTVDNADFVNDDPDNGFVTGPIHDVVTGDLLVNDQMILVTSAEILAMAEMATLQAYRSAIQHYLQMAGNCTVSLSAGTDTTAQRCADNGGTWTPVYPWLYNYDGIEYDISSESVDVAIDKISEYFPAFVDFNDEDDYLGFDADSDGHFGRVPSMFGRYFVEVSNPPFYNSQPVETRLLNNSLTLIDSAASDTYGLTCISGDGCPGESTDVLVFQSDPVDGGPFLEFDISQVLTGVEFQDKSDIIGSDGRLRVNFPANETIGPIDVYFYDNDHSPIGIWTACPDGADQLLDCSRDSSGDPTPGLTNQYKSRILHMQVTLQFSSGVNNFDFNYDPGTPLTLVTPADGASHAMISATYTNAHIVSFPGTLSASYRYMRHWHENDTALDPDDATYAEGTVDLTGFSLGSLTLGMRYYPELPRWVWADDWHNAIRMAYAVEYEPPGTGPCTIDSTCLKLDDSPGGPQDKVAVLVIAGSHDWEDADGNGRLRNDLVSVFDGGNENNNKTFYRHRDNDKLLVIEEL